ncbi:hypothetical protein ES707_00330 [subsurface metagenome]
MKISVDIKGDKEIARALRKMSEDKKRKIKGEVYASGHDVRTEAQSRLREQGAWDLGNLANSMMVDLVEAGMVAEVWPEAPYGVYVEHGTRPHFPPPDALEGWAKRHGFDSAWPICKAIAKRGLPARPFLFPAWLAVKDKFWKRIKEILER